jgi:mandelamide amidase
MDRYDHDGVIPNSHTRDTVGPLARSVRDIILLDGIMAGDTRPIDARDLSTITLGVPRKVDLLPENWTDLSWNFPIMIP